MTNEEAIKDIQDNILPVVGGKSLLMAIEALKAQIATDTNVGDMISRQAAIDEINERQRKLIYCFGFENDAVKIMDIAKSIVVAVPSAQPDIIACGDCNHWICHDRRCGYWNHGVKPIDWCCHAERRTDGKGRD